MRRALMLLSALAVLAAAAAGCGGGSDRPSGPGTAGGYVAQVAQVSSRVQVALAEISDQRTGDVTAAGYGTALDRSVRALDAAVRQLDAIVPPARARDAHALLVSGLGELADAFRATATAAHSDDPAALATALRRVSTGDGTKKIGRAQAELKALGLAIGQR